MEFPETRVPDVAMTYAELEAMTQDQQQLLEALVNQRDELLAALKRLAKEHVIALEGGYDRIKSLGGDCDPVDVMERNSRALRDTRALIARAEANKL